MERATLESRSGTAVGTRVMVKQVVGTMLPNQSLLNEQEAHKAIKAAVHTMRFERYSFINDTYNYKANLVVFHGLSTLDRKQCDLSKEYRDETGVVIGGVNLLPATAQETLLPDEITCACTTIKAYAELVHLPTGQIRIVELPVWEIPMDQHRTGTFWRSVGHKLSEVNNLGDRKSMTPFEGLVFSVVDPQTLSMIRN